MNPFIAFIALNRVPWGSRKKERKRMELNYSFKKSAPIPFQTRDEPKSQLQRWKEQELEVWLEKEQQET